MPVRLQGLAGDILERRHLAVRDWQRHPTLVRFLEDHFPGPWERIQRCRRGGYKTYQSVERPDIYKAVPYACHQIPFCILCTRADRVRRVKSALDNFSRCTPAGKEPRFYHIVQTAPIYENGTGWGVEASRDIKAFGAIVWETLRDFTATGAGALLSYQDFGERAFAKRHPHMDLTLNGWSLQDGEAVPTPRIELAGGGRRSWDHAIASRATRLRIDAQPGNVDIRGPWTGAKEYYRVLSYQLRELVDLRKVEYSRTDQTVHWLDYKNNRRERFTVPEFKAGLGEYQWRLKQWGEEDDDKLELHRYYGHIAKRSIRATQKAVGGAPIPHGKSCPCSDCGDWERVFIDDLDEPAVVA